MEESFGFARHISPLIRPRTVVRLHGPWFLNGTALGRSFDREDELRVEAERQTILLARAVSSPSQDTLDRVRRHWGVELPDAAVIPNPAPRVESHRRWSVANSDSDLILFVGRFDRHKGGDLVIEAFARLATQNPTVRLLFAGPDRGLHGSKEGPESLQDFIARTIPDGKVRERIECCGPLEADRIEHLRRQAGVTVVASRFEVFPMVVLEAMAFGSPLVASRAGGIPELIRDGENGLLFRSEDSENLAAQLQTILANRNQAEALGQRAALDAENRFDRDQLANHMEGFYRQVLQRPGPTRAGRALDFLRATAAGSHSAVSGVLEKIPRA
jgi:glycosyltransferase involved in cell wall biosynthesis